MTLTIPTTELVGAITDVAAFAWTDDEIPAIHAVRLELDDEHLHTFATDRYRIGWSRWSPDTPPDEPEQEELGVEWGWGDDPWSCSLRLDDALHLVKVFSLPVKEGWTPVTIDYRLPQLTVRRQADEQHPAYTAVYETVDAEFPNIRGIFARSAGLQDISGIAYTARYLADFAKVRPHGPLELFFSGRTRPTLVRIGDRFDGAIMPCRMDDDGPADHATLRSAAELAILTQHASKDMLTKRLHITGKRAAAVLDGLQQHGIAKTLGGGAWQVVVATEDLERTLADLDERLRADAQRAEP